MQDLKVLYTELVNLTQTNDAFSYKDFVSIGGGKFRVFSYRLASYTDFRQPSALESRGIMFEIDEAGDMVRLASRPPAKFFNAYENPYTMYDLSTLSSEIAIAMNKLDGSIISTFMDNDYKVRTKSQTSLYSEHAINANAIIEKDKVLQNEVNYAEVFGFTVNFEYTSPEYRIVLPYQKDELTVLNVRNRSTGELIVGDRLKEFSEVLYSYSVFAKCKDINDSFPMKSTLKESINAVYEMTGIEGFVLVLNDGRMCKVKTDWYCSLHYNKDSINVSSRLFEAVLNAGTDDLKQMFSTDEYCLKKIEKMEQLVFLCYNKLVHDTEKFYEENKHLERKEYALKVQKELPNELGIPGIVFNLYNNKVVNYKDIMLKYMKDIIVDFDSEFESTSSITDNSDSTLVL